MNGGLILQHRGQGVVELRWREDGAPMSDAAFKATLSLLALVVERLLPGGILIDATHFSHRFGAGVMEWRNDVVIPRYGAAGVRRFAFVMPPSFPHLGEERVEGPAVFPTCWFASRPEAMEWLKP